MDFEVLGPVRVRDADRTLPVAGRLQSILLGVLASQPNVEVPVDVLVEALWSAPDRRTGQKLHQHVHKLRRVLGDPDRIRFGRDSYRLVALVDEVDAPRFESLLDEATRLDDPHERAKLLHRALDLWRGTPFAGLDVPVLADESARLIERRLIATEHLYEAEIDCGRAAAVVTELTDLVRRHPLRERCQQLLVTALYATGRRADALAAYQSARTAFVDELGLEPGTELRQLEALILDGEPLTATPASGPAAIEVGRRTTPAQLPRDAPHFVGRADELSMLDTLWSTAGGDDQVPDNSGPVPVVVLAGTAGAGKTALAIRWAHHHRRGFPDGQLYVDLHGYGPGNPVSVEDALSGFLRALGLDASAIPVGVVEQAARFRSLVDGRRMLVVLDNAQSVEQVRPLLPGSRSCFVLVTSRDSLAGLVVRDGAYRIGLDRLAPAEATQLVRTLLGDRASPEATYALVDRCARLPLALRIAAESIRMRNGLRLADVVDDLGGPIGRLDVLDTGADPHTDIRAVFSWSYRQLSAEAAGLFRLMGLLSFDATAAVLAALTGSDQRTIRRSIQTLTRAHLIEEVHEGRFGMHDLLRAYAAERVAEDEDPAVRQAALRRVLTWYLHTAVAARRVLVPQLAELPIGRAATGPEVVFAAGGDALAWYDAERSALVALVATAAGTGEHDLAWRIAATSLAYFNISKHWGDWIASHRIGVDSAARLGDRVGEAIVRNGLGAAYDDIGEFDQALECHLRAAELFLGTEAEHLAAWNLNNLGVTYDRLGRFAEAIDRHLAALALFRVVDDRRGQAYSLTNLGDIHRQRGEFTEAAQHLRQAVSLQEAAGNRDGLRFTLCTLGDLHRDAGQSDEATNCYRRALDTSWALGDRWQAAQMLVRLGELHRTAAAVHQLRAAYRLFSEIGDADAVARVGDRLAALGACQPVT
ncbi:BTAD domain-containing putative transcriptional regulator [Micromonospora sp. NPDC003197]